MASRGNIWSAQDPPEHSIAPGERTRSRAVSQYLVAGLRQAKAMPGTWGRIDRAFKTEANARSTASCIQQGFLRLTPLAGELFVEHEISVGKNAGKIVRYLAVGAGFEVRVVKEESGFFLFVRYHAA